VGIMRSARLVASALRSHVLPQAVVIAVVVVSSTLLGGAWGPIPFFMVVLVLAVDYAMRCSRQIVRWTPPPEAEGGEAAVGLFIALACLAGACWATFSVIQGGSEFLGYVRGVVAATDPYAIEVEGRTVKPEAAPFLFGLATKDAAETFRASLAQARPVTPNHWTVMEEGRLVFRLSAGEVAIEYYICQQLPRDVILFRRHPSTGYIRVPDMALVFEEERARAGQGPPPRSAPDPAGGRGTAAN